MAVEVVSKHLVYPAQNSVPVGRTVVLSNNDQIMPRLYTRMAYYFTPSSDLEGDEEFMSSQVLRQSLAQTLSIFWPVVGKFKERGNGGLDIESACEGIEFLDVKFKGSFEEEICDYQPKAALSALHSEVGTATPISENPLLKIQLSRFKCGRVCLVVALHHAVCDGQGVSDFMTAWANIASGKGISAHPHLDRLVMKVRDPPSPSFEHIEYTTQLPSYLSSGLPPSTAKLVEFSAAQIQILKEQANQDANGQPFTAFEALAGHVWQCVTMAREVEETKNVKLGFAIDGRERFVPPLPGTYFGNVNFYGLAQTTAGDLVSKPLSHAAACIQRAKLRVNDQYMRSALDWVELQSSPLAIFPSFIMPEDLALTSWSRFSAYEVDFGWGRPCFFSIPVASWGGLVIFLPSQHGPNSVNVLVGLNTEHMHNLMKNPRFSPEL